MLVLTFEHRGKTFLMVIMLDGGEVRCDHRRSAVWANEPIPFHNDTAGLFVARNGLGNLLRASLGSLYKHPHMNRDVMISVRN